jgi:hypothetical protein
VEWVYIGKFNVDMSMADNVAETDAKHKALFALYRLGEELGDVKLRNIVMDCLVTRGHGVEAGHLPRSSNAYRTRVRVRGSSARPQHLESTSNVVTFGFFLVKEST